MRQSRREEGKGGLFAQWRKVYSRRMDLPRWTDERATITRKLSSLGKLGCNMKRTSESEPGALAEVQPRSLLF